MIDIADAKRVAEIAIRLRSAIQRFDKRREAWDRDPSPKQAQKLNADLNWAGMDIDKIERELHVACVDAGIADLRDASHYDTRDYRPSGWHHYQWTPPQPRSLVRESKP
jgi:hypothetical protein